MNGVNRAERLNSRVNCHAKVRSLHETINYEIQVLKTKGCDITKYFLAALGNMIDIV